jgi:hypothetical protein
MRRHAGGTEVEGGYYWSLRSWELVRIPGDAGLLPGTSAEPCVRVPAVLVPVLAPVMGGLFAFFLPAAGFAVVAQALATRLGLLRPGAAAPPPAESGAGGEAGGPA